MTAPAGLAMPIFTEVREEAPTDTARGPMARPASVAGCREERPRRPPEDARRFESPAPPPVGRPASAQPLQRRVASALPSPREEKADRPRRGRQRARHRTPSPQRESPGPAAPAKALDTTGTTHEGGPDEDASDSDWSQAGVCDAAILRKLQDPRAAPADLLSVVEEDAYRFTLAHCAAALGALAGFAKDASLPERADPRWKLLLKRLRELLDTTEVKPKQLATAACGLVRLGLREAGVLRALARAARGVLPAFTLPDLASLLWALAKANVDAGRLFDAAAEQAAVLLRLERKPHAVAMLVWAFAKADVPSEMLFSTVASKGFCERFVMALNAQELSNLVWAYAKLGHAGDDLFKEVAKAATPKVEDFSCTELSNMIWAFAQASVVDETFFRAVAQVALPRMTDFTPAQQYNLLWGYLIAYSRETNIYHCGCGRVLVRI